MAFGGVAQASPSVFKNLNGYSNNFWGWGGEDVEMFWRIKKGLNLTIIEADPEKILFNMLEHKHWGENYNQPNPNRKAHVFSWKQWRVQGLTSLHYAKFEIQNFEYHFKKKKNHSSFM